MICNPCKEGEHCDTAGCTCQHKAQVLTVDGISSSEAVGDIGG